MPSKPPTIKSEASFACLLDSLESGFIYLSKLPKKIQEHIVNGDWAMFVIAKKEGHRTRIELRQQ